MRNVEDRFSQHLQNRERLKDLFVKTSDIYSKLELRSDGSTLEVDQDKLSNDTFKVLVLGEFKRGKSTFINALLGEEVLPAFAIPCTAVINEIKWGEESRAVLHFVDRESGEYPDNLSREVMDHLAKHRGKSIPPLPIPVNEIEKYVVIPDPGKDQAVSIAEVPYSKVEIFWPIDLCRNSVEIIDSPGLNEHGTRTRITTDYLATVDAVVFVLSCHALASQSEMQFIDYNIIGGGHEDIFYVCNRFDEVRTNERDRIIAYGQSKLKDRTTFGNRGIYFISAIQALDGCLGQDEKLLEQSGLNPLTDHLSHFLVNDRGRVKLLQPARDLRRLLNKVVFEYVPEQQKMLGTKLEDLERRYEEVKPQLEDAERKRNQIIQKVNTARQRLSDGVRKEVSAFIKDLSHNIVEALKLYEPQSKYKFISLEGSKQQTEKLVKELTTYASDYVELEQSKWVKEHLQPFIMSHIEELGEGIRTDVDSLLKSVDHIKSQLSQVETLEQKDSDRWERVLAAAGGWLIAGPGSGLIGGMFGYKEMLKSLVPNIAVTIAMMAILGIANPLFLIPALLATGSIQGMMRAGTVTKDIKDKVSQKLSLLLRDSAEKSSEKAAKDIYQKTEEVVKQLDAGLEKEIQSVKESVEGVLAAKRQGEAQAKQRSEILNAVMLDAKEIQGVLDDLLFEVQPK